MKPSKIHAMALVAAGLLGAACDPQGAISEEVVSDRGGFADPEQRLAEGAERDYCAAEVLRWRYEEATGTLRIADARVLLGCCGRRGASVERVDGMIELTEVDAPDADGRCEAACSYDVAVSVVTGSRAPVVLRVLRDITDAQGGPSLVWQGVLDPGQGAGAVVLSDTPADPSCQDR
jgi:hypothetical protein